jgi:hypothetical protein
MKVCTRCKVEKEFTEFSIQKSAKDGVRSSCKECLKIDARKYYLNNKEVMLSKHKIYSQNNKEKLKEKSKIRYINNKEKVSEKGKLYRLKNSDKVKESKKIYYETNKETLKPKYKEYRLKNKENRNKAERERRKSDSLYRLKSSMRSLINLYITKKGYVKSLRTEEVLGCTFEEFKVHIENQFTEGMSWENRSEWHLDHIIPVVLAKTEEEVIKLNHYKNFQPLWAEDNLKKGIKINN